MTKLPLLAALAIAATLTACGGGPPADLFLVTRSGSIPGAKLTLRVIDDGGVSCNGGTRHDITSEQLIEARELRRELDGDDHAKDKAKQEGLAAQRINLPPGSVTTLSYRVRSEKGTVVFSDTSARQPQAFYRMAKLTRDLARQACGLPR
ncbi:hypothetical protein [Baekduia sp. Peel2402]|uniref:hypothetical protein n=1 Tax=Baekduia sp. Peel2402 TaxID=3458296 RepID=UPI00403ED73B